MKNITFLIAVLFSINTTILSQSCLPEGISFIHQSQIDDFQTNYPGCTEIEGYVIIADFYQTITNLNGLSVITSIGGDFKITSSAFLTNLSGLDELMFVGGDLMIGDWSQYGPYNESLTSLAGLDNLSTIGGDLSVRKNHLLVSLAGLENLNSIPGSLIIEKNSSLNSLSGLENVNSIAGELTITNNYSLNSLNGINNINTTSIENLQIYNNTSLTNCEAQNICDFLVSPSGTVDIYNNSAGCDNPSEVANGCGITLSCLPYGNYYFLSQDNIENFQMNYPDCSNLEGNVTIKGIDITDLNGLSQINSIRGSLMIGETYDPWIGNPILTSLAGLEDLVSIGGNLWISSNDSLTSLAGLDNLDSIGGGLFIGLLWGGSSNRNMEALSSILALGNLNYIGGDLYIQGTSCSSFFGLDSLIYVGANLEIYGNDYLISLSAFTNLLSIGGKVNISCNDVLPSLSGLDNIDPTSITGIWILNNNSLSTCAVMSVCDYLAMPGIDTWIQNNATGCNSQEEVEQACLISVVNPVGNSYFSLFPNPITASATLEYCLNKPSIVQLSIYDYHGNLVEVNEKAQSQGKHQFIWHAEGKSAGIYFFLLKTNIGIHKAKRIIK